MKYEWVYLFEKFSSRAIELAIINQTANFERNPLESGLVVP